FVAAAAVPGGALAAGALAVATGLGVVSKTAGAIKFGSAWRRRQLAQKEGRTGDVKARSWDMGGAALGMVVGETVAGVIGATVDLPMADTGADAATEKAGSWGVKKATSAVWDHNAPADSSQATDKSKFKP